MAIALYVRVSTTEQYENGYSIEEQIDRLKSFCAAYGWSDTEIYTDAGFSGATTLRPALKRLLFAVQTHKVDKVIVYKLDRLSRSQKDTLMLIEDVFLANGCDFISVSENFDTSTAFGKAMIGILAVFAQLEREQIKERMAMGREGRAKQGLFHGSSQVPIGYDYIDGHLIVNDFEAMQIRKAFKMYCAGKSPYKIADELNAQGLTHKYGPWKQMTVSDCLSRQVYCGKIIHNGVLYNGEHRPIIDQALFDEANFLKEQRSRQHSNNLRRGKITSFLGGLLYCSHCDAKYSKMTKYGHEKYICHSRWKNTASLVKDPTCKNKTWDMNELDNLVFDEIRKLSFDTPAAMPKTDRTDIIRKEIDKKNDQVERLLDLYAVGQMPIDILQDKIEKLCDQKEALEAELERIIDEKNKKVSLERTRQLIASFGEVLKRGDHEEIRTVIEALIDRIYLDNNDVKIHWNF